MDKKLVKTRSVRTNTLEAMGCGCTDESICKNCSGGGSYQARETVGRRTLNISSGKSN